MRKNHHGKKDRLVKRVFALCLALAVICTCLVPVFATEGLIDPQVNQEASRPVDDGEASYPDDEFAGFGEEEATRPVDGGEAAGFGEDEVATRPVEGGEDNLDGGPNVKETEWGTVIEYDTSTSTDPSSSTETQWSGEDDVVEKPDDKVVVSGDEIKKLQDMVVYRFWLKELNTLDLQDITAQAQINNMTESEYLARNGEVLWNLYFIQAVPRAETIADYSSYIENPSSNRDPKGELRLFDYWYTLDEFGNRVRLNLTDPTSNILDDKTTTVNVYAAWKDGTVGSDEEEDVDHEDLVDKNPVPVDLTAKASASYEDEDGNTKSVNLPVEVKNLPSAAHSLSVIHMGDDDMESFYKSHEDDFGSMAPILGLKISPKNAKGDTVQPAKGEKATVTVSGLEKLPEIAAMEEEEALTADALKVLHQKADGSVETLDVLTYTNGTLTFETSSFSPFVVVRMDGYDVETLSITGKYKSVVVNKTITLTSDNNGLKNCGHTWKSSNNSIATVQGSDWTATVTGVKAGDVIITHEFLGYTGKKDVYGYRIEEKFNVTVDDLNAGTTGQWVYLYAHVSDECMKKLNLKESDKNFNGWFTLGKVWVSDLKSAGSSDFNGYSGHTRTDTETSVIDTLNKELNSNNQNGYVVRYEKNQSIDLSKVKWTYNTDYGLTRAYGADDYTDGDYTMYTWHLDGYVDDLANLEIHFYDAETNKEIKTALKEVATIDTTAYASKYSDAYPTIFYQSEQYKYNYTDTPSVTIENNKTNIIKLYYAKVVPTKTVTIEKQVKGYFGDTRKEFEFSLDFGGEDISKITAARSDGSAINDLSSFTLKHGQYVTLTNVPIGATVTVTEKTPGALYGVTATGYEEAKSGATDVSYVYTIAEAADVQSTAINEAKNFEGDKIVVVNTATLFPDTGVLLDTLPYIVILAVVAGGVALLMLRKHRKEDD